MKFKDRYIPTSYIFFNLKKKCYITNICLFSSFYSVLANIKKNSIIMRTLNIINTFQLIYYFLEKRKVHKEIEIKV